MKPATVRNLSVFLSVSYLFLCTAAFPLHRHRAFRTHHVACAASNEAAEAHGRANSARNSKCPVCTWVRVLRDVPPAEVPHPTSVRASVPLALAFDAPAHSQSLDRPLSRAPPSPTTV